MGRATASLSLTVGVALATSLVVAAIIAGPIVADCAAAPGGLGACVRNEIAETALAPDTAVVPVAPSPVTAPPMRRPGWIEANATEYAPARAGEAVLSPPLGTVAAGEAMRSTPSAIAVVLAPNGGDVSAGTTVSPPPTSPTVTLTAAPHEIDVASPAAPGLSPAEVALLGRPAGDLAAGLGATQPPAGADASLSAAPVAIAATSGTSSAAPLPTFTLTPLGIVSGFSDTAPARVPSVELEATGASADALATGSIGTPSQAVAEAALAAPAVDPPPSDPPSAPADLPAAVAVPPVADPVVDPPPMADPPHPIAKYNPRFPNVLVLPAPTRSGNSSVVLLKLN